jgi:hypothetical protein
MTNDNTARDIPALGRRLTATRSVLYDSIRYHPLVLCLANVCSDTLEMPICINPRSGASNMYSHRFLLGRKSGLEAVDPRARV